MDGEISPLKIVTLLRNISDVLEEISTYCRDIHLPLEQLSHSNHKAGESMLRSGQNLDKAEQYLTDIATLHRQLSEMLPNVLLTEKQISDISANLRLPSLKDKLIGEDSDIPAEPPQATVDLF